MPQSLVKYYMHITFSTKNSHSFLDKLIKAEMFSYPGGICRNLECNPLIVGGYYDCAPMGLVVGLSQKPRATYLVGARG